MFRAIVISLFGLTLMSAAPAVAFIDPPELMPSPATAGEMVTVGIRLGQCDAILGGADNPTITTDGSNVDVLFDGIRQSNPVLCVYPVVEPIWEIGQFAPGHYSVTIRFRYRPLISPPQIIVLANVSLEVIAADARQQPVPVLNGMLLLILTMSFLAIARRFGPAF